MIFKSRKNKYDAKKPEMFTSQTYQKWRDMIFTITPEQVGIAKEQPGKVYGVIMDIGLVD
jgi:RNA polymerase subunit RPABC4/transcription elongation factor Spt4